MNLCAKLPFSCFICRSKLLQDSSNVQILVLSPLSVSFAGKSKFLIHRFSMKALNLPG